MARVYVDGRLAGKAGDSQRAPLEVPVPTTGDNPYDAPAEMRLERDGYLPVRATVRLRAGADVTFAAPGRELPGPSPAAPVSATPPGSEEPDETAPAPESTRR